MSINTVGLKQLRSCFHVHVYAKVMRLNYHLYTVKRYFKQLDLLQKGSVGSSLGSRLHQLVGGTHTTRRTDDQDFLRRLEES